MKKKKKEKPTNVHCNNCGEYFNEDEIKNVMEEGVGKHLYEVPACPHCKSTDIDHMPNGEIKLA